MKLGITMGARMYLGFRWAGLAITGMFLLAGADAQEEFACDTVVVEGLSTEDSFGSIYTNTLAGLDVRGDFEGEDSDYHIWYAAGEPDQFPTLVTDLAPCNGFWVISSSPTGDTFQDLVWYQSPATEGCAPHPTAVEVGSWERYTRTCSADAVQCPKTLTVVDVAAVCPGSIDVGGGTSDGDSTAGISRQTMIVIVAAVTVGLMVLLCLGSLACCLKGSNAPSSQGIGLPIEELRSNSGSGSGIGSVVADASTEPGIHAHPQNASAHPRPEDRAPSFSGSMDWVGRGSKSGPSVRSIGYEQ
ncbi:unnamed protein product [Discosporangium mesarthrocarpum]